jgi:proline dehydrogenase
MSAFDSLVRHGLPIVPKFVVGAVAKRYVAGESLDDAVRTVRTLNGEGSMATCDVLGEEVTQAQRAEEAVGEYLRLLDRIAAEGLDSNVSIKPTLLGLKIAEELCARHVDTIVEHAARLGNFVRIDMEDHTCTDATLRIYRQVHERHGHVGVVLQSYLHRTPSDVNHILPLEPNVRLCKGIYREPRTLAWQEYETVRANFVYCLQKLLRAGAYVGIATHDPYLVWAAMAEVDRLRLEPDRYEFQMLLGVDPELRRTILSLGHRMRVYVPYGGDWYPYSTRRLRENPTVAKHVLRAMIGLQPTTG